MSTVLDRDVDQDLQHGEPRVAHIVMGGPDESSMARVARAIVNGTPVEALCGHRFVPKKRGSGLPVCAPCMKAYMLFSSFGGGDE